MDIDGLAACGLVSVAVAHRFVPLGENQLRGALDRGEIPGVRRVAGRVFVSGPVLASWLRGDPLEPSWNAAGSEPDPVSPSFGRDGGTRP